jgi:hypothetical protein
MFKYIDKLQADDTDLLIINVTAITTIATLLLYLATVL